MTSPELDDERMLHQRTVQKINDYRMQEYLTRKEQIGKEEANEAVKDKIVVIDDPVSSMDSGALFIVSALVREMIEVCYNNTDYRSNKVDGDYIKQIFILTHNVYFHKEITHHQEKNFTAFLSI